jgi:hypothetical protein
MVFIETGQEPMELPHQSTSVLLLERPLVDAEEIFDRGGFFKSPLYTAGDRSPERSNASAGSTAGTDPILRSPGLALLAAVSVLQGYKWLGVIPTSDTRLSTLAFGRVGALLFAAACSVAVVALTRPVAFGHRPSSHRLLVLATISVMAATVGLVVTGGNVATHVLGFAYLLTASLAAGLLFSGERRKRQAERAGLRPLDRTAETNRAFPVA